LKKKWKIIKRSMKKFNNRRIISSLCCNRKIKSFRLPKKIRSST